MDQTVLNANLLPLFVGNSSNKGNRLYWTYQKVPATIFLTLVG
ncbi:hypothetical protein Plano_2315 [Planococcus sp. PAMC 21323]|nr:hypothetical protein Plano_2315 [Planococcus sp. PAMC 21323]